MSKISLQIKPDKFNEFSKKLEDLCKISDIIKLKIDSENILMYSIVGETILIAFKSYIIKTNDFFEFKNELESVLDIVIAGSKKFVKNLGFIKTSEKIQIDIDTRKNDDNILNARFLQIKNGKFKLGVQGGESFEIRDISKDVLDKRVDIKNEKWSFKVKKEEFQDIKKLSNINSEGKLLHLNSDNGKILLSEMSSWEYQVDELEISDKHLMFNKSFLSSINDNFDYIQFHVFDSFILTKDDESYLMLSFETSFEE